MPGIAAPSSAQTMPSHNATIAPSTPSENSLGTIHLGEENGNRDERANADHFQHVGRERARKPDAANKGW